MDDVVNKFAKELADAIAAAIADNSEVEACRTRARESGYDMRLKLEAVVGFVNRSENSPIAKVAIPARQLPAPKQFDLTNNDKRYLRSLRIAGNETKETVE